ncbi:hypothetical protein KHA80_14505 [Anaerobacillus sp. HL2]|nr:hypothetical protein KHA80_14505 [Anaerobacillus sp. HL2]
MNMDDLGGIKVFTCEPTFAEDGTNGQVMTQIPKFYYRVERIGTKLLVCSIQDKALCFIRLLLPNGKEVQAYMGAYEGSLYDMSAAAYLLADEQVADFTANTGDKLSSIAGAKPASGLTRPTP